MEYHSFESINCCFCDKDLSTSENNKKSLVIKYKCPGCERIYCSANCSSGHKDKFDCAGVRNKTPYIHLSKFDQKQFLDDYFFLEEVNEKIESAHRAIPKFEAKKKTTSRKKNWRPRWKRDAHKTSNDTQK